MRTLLLVSSVILVAGCSGAGDGDDPGGFVRIEHRITAGGAEATFARAEFGRLPETRPKAGHCKAPSSASDGSWIDAGDSLTLSGGGIAPIVLPRTTLGSLIAYGADGLPASDSPEGAELDVTLAGSDDVDARTWENALEIPPAIVPDDIANQIGFDADQEFTWADSGAEEIVLEIAAGGHVDLVCRAKGSSNGITVPAALNSELDSGGGTLTYRAINRRYAPLAGGTVSLEGQSVVVVPYQ